MNLRRVLHVAAGLLAGVLATPAGAWPPPAEGFDYLGYTHDPALKELSGLALSRRDPNLLWGINDSGNAAQLIAIDLRRPENSEQLRLHAVINVQDVVNNDWEDIATYVDGQGRSILVVADTGDNFSFRSEVQLVFFVEPPKGKAANIKSSRVLQFEYEDGPRDCESMAIDVPGKRILLADKGRSPPGLYELRLDGPDRGQKARRIADFPPLTAHGNRLADTIGSKRYRGAPVGMDLSADGLRLAVITGDSLSLFVRKPSQEWKTVLAQPFVRATLPAISGFESVGLDAAGRRAWVGVEGDWAHLYRWDVPAAP